MVGSHLLLPIPFEPLLKREYADILQQQFNKRYSFPDGPLAPPSSSDPYKAPYWRDTRLQSMKQRLNATKSKLNEMPLNKWHKHTKKLNPAGTVTQELKKRIQPELMTQAWQKFYECFQGFNLGPRKKTAEDLEAPILFNSVHLCEAPGAFVTSLNHALSVSHPGTTWTWLATTLNPHYEGNDLGYMINDDRFIMGSLDNWFFGEDDTGDLLARKNADKLVGRAREAEGGIHLVTADGSIDCQGDPARQESIVADLHLTEAIVAMRMLAAGGSLVIKMFTFFESETVCLLYLLNLAFGKLDVFKPATSKEGNSEVYVICRGFTPSSWLTDFLDKMMEYFGDFPTSKSLFPEDAIPEKFLDHVRKCGDLFMQLQENVIENNLHYWTNQLDKAYMKDLAEIQLQVAEKYVEKYQVESIASYRHVVYNRADPYVTQVDPRTDRGTYLDKASEADRRAEERLKEIRQGLQGWKVKGRHRFVEWVPCPALGGVLEAPVIGKKIASLRSSKFCTGRHLDFYRTTLELLEKVGEEEEDGGGKRRKVDKTVKSYQATCKQLADYKEDVFILKKLCKIYPEIEVKTKVLFLTPPGAERVNMLDEECSSGAQVRLISTIMEAVAELEKGQHLLVQGLPLYTRLCTSIFLCLAALFQESGFVRPSQQDDFIFLSNFLGGSNTAEESVNRLEGVLTSLLGHKGPGQVLSVWPVRDLVQDPIYSELVTFNQLRIKERVLCLTAFLEPKKEGKLEEVDQ